MSPHARVTWRRSLGLCLRCSSSGCRLGLCLLSVAWRAQPLQGLGPVVVAVYCMVALAADIGTTLAVDDPFAPAAGSGLDDAPEGGPVAG